jgi:hypothetical protein
MYLQILGLILTCNTLSCMCGLESWKNQFILENLQQPSQTIDQNQRL